MHEHDLGLDHDLPRLISRRKAVGLLAGGMGSAFLAACGSSGDKKTQTTTSSATEIPEETAGPFPGDGSNGPNVLTESGVVREDITQSIGDASGTATGVPTTVEMTLLDIAGGGTPMAGAAVYLWHCTADGKYSMYDEPGENYLRGVQESGSDGKLSFKTVFPGAYAGRWPHMHFEVYENLDAAQAASTKLRTSQLACPQEACEAVYRTEGYEQSTQNLSRLSLDSDNVFSDGYASQLAKASGSVDDGYTLTLNVGV